MPRRKRTPVVAKSFELSFPTSKLLDLFGLPNLDHIDEVSDDWEGLAQSREDLINNTICLGLDEAEDESGELKVWDLNDAEVPEDALSDLQGAVANAVESGTKQRYYTEVMATLEQCLNDAGNGQYDYDYSTSEGGLAAAHGRAEGIIDVKVQGETTVLTLSTDIVHMINQCIAGRGDFEIPEDDFSPLGDVDAAAEYAKSHLYTLGDYWEIFGANIPQPDTSNLEDFDRSYFKELVAEIEQRYGLKLWSCR